MTPHIYINAVLKIKNIQSYYDDLNKRISVCGEGGDDHCTRIKPIDLTIETAVVKALDDALFSMTGFPELATYYLYENMTSGSWCIHEVDGSKYEWSNDEGYEKAIIKMITTKNKKGK